MTHPVTPAGDVHPRFVLCAHLGVGYRDTNPTADPQPCSF